MWRVLFVGLYVSAACAAVVDPAWILRRERRDRSVRQAGITGASKKELSASPDLYSVHVESLVQLRYATTQFSYRIANPAKQAQEVLFQVILPETAFISSFLMVIDGKTYRATVKEKEKAQAVYNQAVASGQSAAQVASSARDSNKFEVSVNLEAGSKGTFNLTYEELLPRRAFQYELAINLQFKQIVKDISVRVNILEAPPATGIRVKELRTNDHELFDIPGDIATIKNESTGNVQIDYRPTPEQQLKVSPDGLRKFIVQYKLNTSEESGGVIHVIDGFFVHFFAPKVETPLPKHVVFILDISGSMYGTKLRQTKEAMHLMLEQVQDTDYISVIDFSDYSNIWDLKKAPTNTGTGNAAITDAEEVAPGVLVYLASASNKQRIKSMVDALKVTGGTNINDALLDGIRLVKKFRAIPPKPVTALVVFLTDGQATTGETNVDQILVNIRKEDSDRLVSLFSLGFGTGADFELLKKLSLQNKGFARRIYEDADAALQLGEFFRDIASPALTDVEFKYANGTVANVTSPALATYFGGGELVVAGKLKDANALALPEATVQGVSVSGPYSKLSNIIWRCRPFGDPSIMTFTGIGAIQPGPSSCSRPFPTTTQATVTEAPPSTSKSPTHFLERFWSYLTIKDLLRKAELNETEPSYKKKALELSLKYGFVTVLTSLLVVKPNSTSVAEAKPINPVITGGAFGAPSSSSFGGSGFGGSNAVSFSSGGFSSIGAASGLASGIGSGFARPSQPLPAKPRPLPVVPPTTTTTSTTTEKINATGYLSLGSVNLTHIEYTKEGIVYTLLVGLKRPLSTEDQACSYFDYQGVNVTGVCVAPWRCMTHFDSFTARAVEAFEMTYEEEQRMCADRQLYWGQCCAKDQITDQIVLPPVPQPGTAEATP